MRRLALLFLMLAVMFALSSCGGGPEPQPETPPVVDVEPEVPPEEPKEEPPEPPEPEPEPIRDTDFRVVYFDFDKYNLVDSAKTALEFNAGIMQEKPQVAAYINFFLTYVNEEIVDVGYFPASTEALEASIQNWLDGMGN